MSPPFNNYVRDTERYASHGSVLSKYIVHSKKVHRNIHKKETKTKLAEEKIKPQSLVRRGLSERGVGNANSGVGRVIDTVEALKPRKAICKGS